MKTIYTLLFAFGLCLTSHAQGVQNFSSAPEAQLSSEEMQHFKQLTYGSTPALELGTSSTMFYNDDLPVQKIILANPSGVALLNAMTAASLQNVQSLEINWKSDDVYSFTQPLNTQLISLQFIYVKSYQTLTPSLVSSVVGSLKQQFPEVKIVFETLIDR